MKVVLVHGRFANSWEAQGLGYIGAYLRRHAPDVELGFFQGCMDDDETILAGTADADIVAFGCTSPSMRHALGLAGRIKAENPAAHIVFGGYHPSALPDQTVAHPAVDQVVVGEGEAAMLDIVRGDRTSVRHGRPMDFAELPWPDRDLIRNERNIEVAQRDTGRRITSFHSHRGCPFGCLFCADGATGCIFGKHVRFRPVSDLLDEIAVVVDRYGLDFIKFSDGTWNAPPNWALYFCRHKAARGLTIPFFANVHAALASAELFQAMAEAGCREIGLGIESGSERILKSICKGITLDMVRRAVRQAKDAGLSIRGYFMVGSPEETESDLEATEQFAAELELDEYGFSLMAPFPGTAYHGRDPERFADVDWAAVDEYDNAFWSTRHMTNARLREWQARLCERFGRRLTGRQRSTGPIMQARR